MPVTRKAGGLRPGGVQTGQNDLGPDLWEMESSTSYARNQVYAPSLTRGGSASIGVVWPSAYMVIYENLQLNGNAPGMKEFGSLVSTAAYHSLHQFLGTDAPELRGLRIQAVQAMQHALMRARQEALENLAILLRQVLRLDGGQERAEWIMRRASLKLAAVTHEEHRRWFLETLGVVLDRRSWVEGLYREATAGIEPDQSTWQ